MPTEEDGAGGPALGSQARSSSWVQGDPAHKTDPEYAREGQIRPGRNVPWPQKVFRCPFFFLHHHLQEFLNQAPHFQPARGCQHQLLQLRSHFVTSPAPVTDSREPRGSAAPCTSKVLEKQSGFPVKLPKASAHCCALSCEHTSHGGLAAPHRAGSSPRWPPQCRG